MAELIYQQGGFNINMLASDEAANVTGETFTQLDTAIQTTLPHNVPATLKYALENNAFVFSGFKTFHALREIGLSMLNEDGSIKPFQKFLDDVKSIDATYNRNYLNAEYNQALAASQMAARWNDFQQDGDRYNLQYRTAGNNRVREEHAILHGITLPPSDPFWEHYFPPNGWNCRCTAVQVRKNKYPASNSEDAINRGKACTDGPKRAMFRFNPGKTLKLFPEKHPYYKAPSAVRDSAEKHAAEQLRKALNFSPQQKHEILSQPVEQQFDTVHSDNTEIKIHRLRSAKQNDYNAVVDAATLFAKQGHKVLVMPEIHKDETKARQAFGLTINGQHTNPDLKIDGNWVDVKSPLQTDRIVRNAVRAAKQNAIACITDDKCTIDSKQLKHYAERILQNTSYNFNTVYFIIQGKLYKYNSQ